MMRITALLGSIGLFHFFSIQSLAQAVDGGYIKSDYFSNQVPKKPGVATLGNFGNVPINYFTGQPEISVPLMTLTSRELSLPISLNYDASGVKTDELSGQVGMKWALNAASYVVRDLNGLPDEHPTKGYWKFASETDYWNNANTDNWTGYSEKNEYDSKPDEFIINISGRSIRFVFDKYKRAIPIPRQNVKITYTLLNDKIDKFEVVTEDGTKYIFGGTPLAIEERKIESLNLSLQFNYTPAREYLFIATNGNWFYTGGEKFSPSFTMSEKAIEFHNTKWFVQSITSPTNDQITFTYEKKADVKYALKPTVLRAKVLSVILGSYTTTLDGYTWTHPCYFSGCGSSTNITDSKPLVAIRKFTSTVAGSPPPPSYLPGFPPSPGDWGYDVNAIASNNYVDATTESSKYFKPEEFKADPGGVQASHALVTESNIVLKSIQTTVGHKILFDVSSREDLPNAWKYDGLRLINLSGETIKSIKLNYATVNANSTTDTHDMFWVTEALMMNTIATLTQAGPAYYAYFAKTYAEALIPDLRLRKYVFEGLKDYNYKRVFLESIEDATASKKLPLYTFTYDSRELLKRRTTPLADEYGFYRDVAANESFGLKESKSAQMILGYSPIAKSAGNNSMIALLSRITYPTAGYTEFSYTQSTLSSAPRIEFVKDFNEPGKIVNQRQIEYLDPIKNYYPKYYCYQDFNVSGTTNWMKYELTSSSPQNDLPSKGSIEINRKVRVYAGTKLENMGWEDFIFSVNNDLLTPMYSNPPDANAPNGVFTNYTYPFLTPESHDHLEGNLLEQYTFDRSDADNPIRSVKNDYTTNPNGYVPVFIQGFCGGSYQYSSNTKKDFWYGTVANGLNRNRYGRYKIIADWIVLAKTTEKIFSQVDKTKSFAKVTEFVYDNVNLQQIESISYNESAPLSKVSTKTKYVTHTDYDNSTLISCQEQLNTCLADCSEITDPTQKSSCISACHQQYFSPCNSVIASEILAIEELKTSHQISTPIEVQTLSEENGQQKLISAIVYNYLKQGSPTFIKPKEIFGLKQSIDPSSFATSKIQTNGTFTKDSRTRLLHRFDTYDATSGNLLQQTTMDGIVSTYTWAYNNSLVSGFTINPGSSALTYAYDQKPLVGLNFSTDPNGRKNYYEYDSYWRFKLSKDHEGNIVNRYRYNYAAEQNGFDDQLSVCCVFWTGQSLTFSSTNANVTSGTSTYSWDFGNGNKASSTTATNYTYTTAGTYTVTLNKENPEYPPRTVTKVITIITPPTVSICVDGPQRADLCGIGGTYGSCTQTANRTPTSPTLLKATIAGSCPSPTYSWESQIGTGAWQALGSGAQIEFIHGVVGSVNVRCRITNGCGAEIVSSTLVLSTYKSSTNCAL